MVRNPLKRKEETEGPLEIPKAETVSEEGVQIIEREINISLINNKINYVIGLLQKIADACDVDNPKE